MTYYPSVTQYKISQNYSSEIIICQANLNTVTRFVVQQPAGGPILPLCSLAKLVV